MRCSFRRWPRVAAALFLAGLLGAAVFLIYPNHERVALANVARIKPGMTRSEVYAILGRPTKVAPPGPELSDELWQGSEAFIGVEFDKNDVVVSAIPHPDYHPDRAERLWRFVERVWARIRR